ncbi:MAG: hypothetical protein RIC38_13950 [Chromatocurvus sp.]
MAASLQKTRVKQLLTRLARAVMVATVLLAGAVSEGLMAKTYQPAGLRYGKAVGQFHDVHHYAATYQLSPPRRTVARHLELAVAALWALSQLDERDAQELHYRAIDARSLEAAPDPLAAYLDFNQESWMD